MWRRYKKYVHKPVEKGVYKRTKNVYNFEKEKTPHSIHRFIQRKFESYQQQKSKIIRIFQREIDKKKNITKNIHCIHTPYYYYYLNKYLINNNKKPLFDNVRLI